MQEGTKTGRSSVSTFVRTCGRRAGQNIIQCRTRGVLMGLPGSSIQWIINLQYANDTLLFGNFEIRQVIWLKGRLACFELWSGLHIKYHKSSMVLLADRSLTIEFIRAILGCKEEHLPIKYLKILIGRSKIAKKKKSGAC